MPAFPFNLMGYMGYVEPLPVPVITSRFGGVLVLAKLGSISSASTTALLTTAYTARYRRTLYIVAVVIVVLVFRLFSATVFTSKKFELDEQPAFGMIIPM
jgi:hypothetical protein